MMMKGEPKEEKNHLASPRSQDNTQGINTKSIAKLGPQKISRAIIRAHINRRYKKTITDKIMNHLDQHIKSVNMFDFSAYIEILYTALIQ